MSIQNLTLSALNQNSRFSQLNKYTLLAELVDNLAKFGTNAAPTQEQYSNSIKKALEAFPEASKNILETVSSAWTQLLVIYMKNFFHHTFSEKDTPEFVQFENVIDSSKSLDHGFKILELEHAHFNITSHSAQSVIPLNNLELTLAINYGAIEQIINSIYSFKEMDTDATHFCGLDRVRHAQVIDIVQGLADHHYDFLYDLLWGTYDETEKSESYIQRNQALNVTNLFKILR